MIRCLFRHRWWAVVSTRELPSPIEAISDAGVTKFRGGGFGSWEKMGRRPVIVTRRCSDCGTESVVRV